MACRINSCDNDAVTKGFCNSCYAKVLKLFEQRQSSLDVDFQQPSGASPSSALANSNSNTKASSQSPSRPISSGEKDQPVIRVPQDSSFASSQYAGSRDRLDYIREREREKESQNLSPHNRDRLDAIRERERLQAGETSTSPTAFSPRRLSRSTDTLNGASPVNQQKPSESGAHF